MKLRFVAAAGPHRLRKDLEQRLNEASLRSVSAGPSMSVWCFPGTPALARDDGSACLVGLLAGRASGLQPELPRQDTAAERFLREQWGAYVLLTNDSKGHFVLRDPSGAVQVYHARAGALELYTSDAAALELVLGQALRPDVEMLRHWLSFPFLRTARTGALGVSELLPGMLRSVSVSGEALVPAWLPAVAGAERPLTFDEAVVELRRAILEAIPRLVPAGEQVTLQLSGGLDSSIVAAALAHSGRSFRAVTFATRAADGDERPYARAVAKQFGAELVEIVEDDAYSLTLEPDPCPRLRPAPNPLLQPLNRALELHFAATETGLVLDGAGGDNLFAYLSAPSPALDALRRLGPAAALKTLRDIADVHGCTVWDAARFAMRRARRGARPAWRRDPTFLARDAILAEPDRHPWLEDRPELLPGTWDHLRMVVGIQHFLSDPGPGQPARLHPLLAQPLLDLCLGIPTWLWQAGGRDRAVARAAFRGLVPDEVLDRRGKGRLESMFVRGYTALRQKLRPFLLGGRLSELGLIDVRAVEDYLDDPREPRDALYVRLLELSSAERWLRSFPSS